MVGKKGFPCLFVRVGSGIQDTGSGMEENQDPGSCLNISDPQHYYYRSGLKTEKRGDIWLTKLIDKNQPMKRPVCFSIYLSF
jgi:hypothetical protein